MVRKKHEMMQFFLTIMHENESYGQKSKGNTAICIARFLPSPRMKMLFEEDLKFMELLLSKNKDLVKIKKVNDEERGIEMTYITIKKTE